MEVICMSIEICSNLSLCLQHQDRKDLERVFAVTPTVIQQLELAENSNHLAA
jgi:hypothetical protein